MGMFRLAAAVLLEVAVAVAAGRKDKCRFGQRSGRLFFLRVYFVDYIHDPMVWTRQLFGVGLRRSGVIWFAPRIERAGTASEPFKPHPTSGILPPPSCLVKSISARKTPVTEKFRQDVFFIRTEPVKPARFKKLFRMYEKPSGRTK